MLEKQPWTPGGGKFSYRDSLFEDQLNLQMATAIRYVWENLPKESRSMDKVDERLKTLVREEAERVAATPGFLDTDRALIRQAVHMCARLRPEHSTSAAKLAQLILSVLDPELQKAKDDSRRHGGTKE